MKIIKRYINKALHLFETVRVNTSEKVVYLTFDDAPEEGITQFVIDALNTYGAKATFFCRGDYAEAHPELLRLIKEQGHAVGNHTYAHIKGLDNSYSEYIANVEKADSILKTHLFRPPWGAITFRQFWTLRKKYKIVYWSLVSEDTLRERFNLGQALLKLKQATKPGDIVLFHCCKRHENETRKLLPLYLKWLSERGYQMEALH